ncbi:MAG TPA: transporter substrate-binding domain-containing protein [Devosiaceae bacterium]|nr:transporter substrate-binding domain-containing protein [Devosiaceae bacterium]
MRRSSVALGVLFALAAFAGPALAQAPVSPVQPLPNHLDPSAREELPDLTLVPAIRFLTTGGFPPFNYRDGDGQLVGFNIDLARAVCATIRAQCTIQTWPWEQAADALADNQGDALIAGLGIDPQSAERFDFSDIYLALPARFVVARDRSDFDPAEPANVAVRAGSVHQGYVERYYPALTVRPYPTEIDALAAVLAGNVDAYFGDAMRAAFWLDANPDCCGFWSEAYFDPAWFGPGLAIALPADLDSVRRAINWALSRLQRDGRIEEIYLKWFPVGFY